MSTSLSPSSVLQLYTVVILSQTSLNIGFWLCGTDGVCIWRFALWKSFWFLIAAFDVSRFKHAFALCKNHFEKTVKEIRDVVLDLKRFCCWVYVYDWCYEKMNFLQSEASVVLVFGLIRWLVIRMARHTVWIMRPSAFMAAHQLHPATSCLYAVKRSVKFYGLLQCTVNSWACCML